MDCTYKTNLYRIPLFEIVGVTSTYLTYSVGFAFMTSERALQMLLKLLGPNSDMPKVVVTDKDTGMMNAVTNVLPGSSAIMCYFHVGKNVRSRIIPDCKVKQNVVVVDGQKKIVDEEKHSKLVDTIFDAWVMSQYISVFNILFESVLFRFDFVLFNIISFLELFYFNCKLLYFRNKYLTD